MKKPTLLTVFLILLCLCFAQAEEEHFATATFKGSTGETSIDFPITAKSNAYYSKKFKDTRISIQDAKQSLSLVIKFPGKAAGEYELSGDRKGPQVKFAIVRSDMMTSGKVKGKLIVDEVGPSGIKGSFSGEVPVRDAKTAAKSTHTVSGKFSLPTSGMK